MTDLTALVQEYASDLTALVHEYASKGLCCSDVNAEGRVFVEICFEHALELAQAAYDLGVKKSDELRANELKHG